MPMDNVIPFSASEVAEAITPEKLQESLYKPIPDEIEASSSQLGTNVFSGRLNQYTNQKEQEDSNNDDQNVQSKSETTDLKIEVAPEVKKHISFYQKYKAMSATVEKEI